MINTFLLGGRHALRTAMLGGDAHHVTLVVGNEGGDMDSVVCSIFEALFLSLKAQGSSEPSTPPFPRVFCPICNFPREDLSLRGDIVEALDAHGISQEHLSYAFPNANDTESPGSPTDDPHVSLEDRGLIGSAVVLVDHNKLGPRQEDFLSGRVVGVVDHHADEKLYMGPAKAVHNGGEGHVARIRIIEPVGSCASLVALQFKEAGFQPPEPTLLLAPILLDTHLLDPAMKKVTPTDVSAVSFLLDVAKREPLESLEGKAFITSYYKQLQEKKFDVSTLTVPQTLRRDYKQFTMRFAWPEGFKMPRPMDVEIGVTAIVELFDVLTARVGRSAFYDSVADFGLRNNCNATFVMFAANDDHKTFVRELLIVVPYPTASSMDKAMENAIDLLSCPSSYLYSALRAFVEACSGPGTPRWTVVDTVTHCSANFVCRVLRCKQGDVTVSRKQMTPALGAFLESYFSTVNVSPASSV